MAQSVPGESAVTSAGFDSFVPLRADDSAFRAAPAPVADLLWQAGVVGVFDKEASGNFASIEARLHWAWHGLHPWTGLTLVDSGAWFTGAGIVYDLELSRHLRLTWAAGRSTIPEVTGTAPISD